MERKRNVIKTSDIFHNIPNPSGNHCKLLGIQIAMDRTGYDIVRMSATAVSKEKGAIDSIVSLWFHVCILVFFLIGFYLFFILISACVFVLLNDGLFIPVVIF